MVEIRRTIIADARSEAMTASPSIPRPTAEPPPARQKLALRARGFINRSRHTLVSLLVIVVLIIFLMALMSPLIPFHTLLGTNGGDYNPKFDIAPTLQIYSDEQVYLTKAIQNLQFYEHPSLRSADDVLFTKGVNHPFSAELFIGLSLMVQGEIANVGSSSFGSTPAPLYAGRETSLLFGLLTLGAMTFLVLETKQYLLSAVPAIFLVSTPGFIDFSLTLMLDIYLAAFVVMSLVSLYYYLVKGKRWGIWLASVFLGLAFGAKTSLDPVILALPVLLAVLLTERSAKSKLRTVGTGAVLAFAAFAVTNPVILLRLKEHIADVLYRTQGRSTIFFSLENILKLQPILNTTGTSIYFYNLGPNIAIYCAALVGAMALTFKERRNLSKIQVYLLLLALFCGLQLFVCGLVYEEGEQYARFGVYDALLVGVFLICLRGPGFWRKAISLGFVAALLASFASYMAVFSSLYTSTGRANGLMPNAGFPIPYAEPLGYVLIGVTMASLAWSLFFVIRLGRAGVLGGGVE
jgi:hypothetical protein